MLKKFLSYFLPVTIVRQNSPINGMLEVNLNNGKKVLDSERSNYSFGSLERILKKGLLTLNLKPSTQSILVLGMGAGSIVHTFRNELKINSTIHLVEIDPDVIKIAKEFFDLDQNKMIHVYCQDAFEFLLNRDTTYDLIVVDIFIIDVIPAKFLQNEFIQLLASRLNPSSQVLFNTIRHTLPESDFLQLLTSFNANKLNPKTILNLEGSNDLILGTKE